MDNIKAWSAMICLVSVCCSFITFLVPEGSMKKNVNFVVSLFLLSVMIIPFFNKSQTGFDLPDISFENFYDETDYEMEYNSFLVHSSENIAKEKICENLELSGMKDFRVDVSMTSDEDGNVAFSEITVFVSAEETVSEVIIRNKVLNLTGIIPRVVIES